jgi:Domain of unknown function (DUF4157)
VTGYSALASPLSARSPTRSAPPFALSPVRRGPELNRRAHLLPNNPASIPAETETLRLQRKPQVSPAGGALEIEADAMAARIAGHPPESKSWMSAGAPAAAFQDLPAAEAPPIVKQALRSAGQSLDPATRAYMEPRLGADLGGVRIHTHGRAGAAAEAAHASAYTVGRDIFFAPGRYSPHTGEGRRLLAHELSHTVQQNGGKAAKGLSKASVGVQRQPAPPGATSQPQGTTVDTETKKPKTEQVTVAVPAALLPQLQLMPPSLLQPPQRPSLFSPGAYTLGGSSSGQTQTPPLGQPATSLVPAPSQYAPSPSPPTTAPSPYFSPVPQTGSGTPGAAPKAPDRVSLHDFGRLSIGARVGFPDLTKDDKPGAAPSALQESLKQGEILNFILNHQPPSEYSVDPGKLVGAVWGIFATRIDPATAAKIAAGMSSKPKGGGLTYQLDATLLLDLGGAKPGGGGGATLTVSF